MVIDNEICSMQLSSLTYESRNILSSLLNTTKVLPSTGPDKLLRHRDWRGLASLINITTEVAAGVKSQADQTGKVLEIWIGRCDGTATVGRLLEILQIIDRYDIYDDITELASNNLLVVRQSDLGHNNQVMVQQPTEDSLITFHDKKLGVPQHYHAYVLYAKEDRGFVEELLTRMKDNGFKMCTEEDLLPGHATRFAPVSKLISERCQRIILVYSPDFLRSPANTFFMNLAQADAIEKKQIKIIPLMYRQCMLPMHLTYYHNLYYSPPGQKAPYEFWTKLVQSLEIVDLPRITNSQTTHSTMNIAEISGSFTNGYTPVPKVQEYLALPSPSRETASLSDLHRLTDTNTSCDSKSLSSNTSEEKKKKSTFSKIFSTLKGKKHKDKKAIMLES
ncbi:unnamed protein product [Leptidea sinapis]|uniref:TIR domain-containing protein n=1 Tax=Leptidea sinapis TaxID=189913 RepID=A0A5E4QK06_9NEOP|nr:unnamed protein product [Leptidea sinapis]